MPFGNLKEMTYLEKRQMLLMECYQKKGIFWFVAIKGSLFGLLFVVLIFFRPDIFFPETVPHLPSLFQVLLCLLTGWLVCYGLWFFFMWHFGKIKKHLGLEESEGKPQI